MVVGQCTRHQPRGDRAAEHRRGKRIAATVSEAVQGGPDHRRDHGERGHRDEQVDRHPTARGVGVDGEEQRAGERDGDERVGCGSRRVQLDQFGQSGLVGAFGAGCSPDVGDGSTDPAARPDRLARAVHLIRHPSSVLCRCQVDALDERHWGAMSPTTTPSSPSTDEVLAAAVDLARAATVEEAGPDRVGAHLGVEAEDEHVVTHYFASTDPGYGGWRWAATLARAEGTDRPTVDEVVLLPGEGALLPPAWVPWQERLRPGDLGVGDILPTTADDDRLVASYAVTDDDDEEAVAFHFGLGRPRMLSRIGRDDAVDRWYAGTAGPDTPIAKAAPAPCGTCGFWLPVAGALHGFFGVCANEYAPDDSRVVSADHGCGGHSEALVLAAETPPVEHAVLDDYEVVAVAAVEPATEEFGHS